MKESSFKNLIVWEKNDPSTKELFECPNDEKRLDPKEIIKFKFQKDWIDCDPDYEGEIVVYQYRHINHTQKTIHRLQLNPRNSDLEMAAFGDCTSSIRLLRKGEY